MRLRSKTELAALAALAYGPFLASSPGQVSADSKQDLYLDPGRFLGRAVDLWDPHIGAGTVPHQNLGYLFPTGPWFWLFERVGVPDWIAQRLWLGTITLVALLGARWLFRLLGTGPVGAVAGALIYALSPYQLAFTARISVLLLPWAALPWIIGLTIRATRTRDWRAPALAALAVFAVGGINASSLVLVGLGPLLWVVLELARAPGRVAVVLAGAARTAVLTAGLALWWVVGLRLQGTHGLPVLQLTENVRTVAEASTPGDVLRGIGNWFFYGRDRTGYSIDQAADYASNDVVVALSYAVPVAGLVAACFLRWAHRAYFVLLVVVGTVVAVGAWPYDEPTPYGSAWKAFTGDTSLGLAFRNSPRAAPLVVLGVAGLVAAAVGAVPTSMWRRAAGAGVAVLAGAALLPVWQQGYLTDGMQRPEDLPTYWQEAVRAIDAGDHDTRVLEIPGSSFAAYRWGTTVDPITPGLTDRPYLAREVLPSGTAGSANLLDALDRRLQQGTFEPASLAPIARLFGVGTVALRADLERSGRFDTTSAAGVWRALGTTPAGLREPEGFGPPGGDGTDPSLPSVALFDVTDPRPIVRVAPVEAPLVVAGDGDGLVDAAGAGLLDGTSLVLPAAALDDEALQDALDADAHLVLTDSNRRRIQTWFYSLRDTRGPTEQAGETAPDPTGYDFRLEPFPGSDDDSRTVVEQVGGRVEATGGGGPERPEDRGAHAVDGDVETAWRVGGADPRGQSIVIVPDEPVPTDEVRLVQRAVPPGGRTLARVRVEVEGAPPLDVELGPASMTAAGQAVPVPTGSVGRVRIEVLQTSPASPTAGAALPVGLAEVRIGDLRIAERVRPPVDLLQRVGSSLDGHSLDIVLTRLRVDLPDPDRRDDEARLDRRLDLPIARTFGLTGTARPDGVAATGPAGGSSDCRDDLVEVDGAPLPVRLVASGDTFGVAGCAPVELGAGTHSLTAAPGAETGIDVDRLVLSTGPGGAPAAVAPRGAPADAAGSRARISRQGDTNLTVEVDTDGEPFWLVLAQSSSDGWDADATGATVGARQLVDGYANGWLITPDRAGPLSVGLRWGPQRLVWVGFAGTGVTLAVIGVLLWRTRRRRVDLEPPLAAAPTLLVRTAWFAPVGVSRGLGASVAVGLGAVVVAPPSIALLAAVTTALAALVPRARLLPALVAIAALVVSRADARPSLAWLAVALLAADLLLTPRPAERG